MPDLTTWQPVLPIVGASFLGYLLGSIPTARWVARRRGLDPLQVGEGNPGATNVWRLLGPRAGLVVLAADIGKGAVAAGAGLLMGGWWAGCAGLVLAMAGHAWPPWSGFRGGRSVACLIGGGLMVGPLPAAIAICLFLVLRRPLGLWRATTIGLLSYPPLFWALAADRWHLIGIGVAYLILVVAWTLLVRRRTAAAA